MKEGGNISDNALDVLSGRDPVVLECFHTAEGETFADIMINGHRETWPIRTKDFRRMIEYRYVSRNECLPRPKAIRAALDYLDISALHEGQERTIHYRTARYDGCYYIDLGDSPWSAIELSSQGWRIVQNPPVRFRRFPGRFPLSFPTGGGSLQNLRSIVNLADDQSFALLVAWLLDALRHQSQHPVLVLEGGEGTAKSTLLAVLQALIDPTSAPLCGLPNAEWQLRAQAETRYLLAYDNVSVMPQRLSDAICRISTSGGRPIIINGRNDVVLQNDLADRCVFLTCDCINDERRRSNAHLFAEFEAMRGQIFGLLLDAFSYGLGMEAGLRVDRLPRMADFALWAMACETFFWPTGTFIAAYSSNRMDAAEKLIEANAVASAVQSLMLQQASWVGSATKLLIVLGPVLASIEKAYLPVSPRDLAMKLRKAAPSLAKVGIEVRFNRSGHNRDRIISITTTGAAGAQQDGLAEVSRDITTSAPSAPSAVR